MSFPYTNNRLVVGRIPVADWNFWLTAPSRVELLENKTQLAFYAIGISIYVEPLKPDLERTASQTYQYELNRRPVGAFDLIEETSKGLSRFCYRSPSTRSPALEAPMLFGVIIGQDGSQITLGVHFEDEASLDHALSVWRSFNQEVQNVAL